IRSGVSLQHYKMTNIDTVSTAIGILGNITAVLLFMSPLPTFYEICKKKSTGSFSGVPYLCSLANCLIWVFYGLPIITHNLILVITINGFGVFMESLYLLVYVPFAQGKNKMKMLVIILIILVAYGIIIVLTLTVLPIDKRALFVGTIAAVLNTAMYAAPLAAMRNVIQTKSVDSMPFLLSLCTFVNSCLWAIYGILKKDPFIIIPNALGIIFGIMQLALYAHYHKYQRRATTGDGTNGMVNASDKRREATQHV
ncbi:hypothetical protein GOP47_0024651, partial [Adiantum capillus-veneris]